MFELSKYFSSAVVFFKVIVLRFDHKKDQTQILLTTQNSENSYKIKVSGGGFVIYFFEEVLLCFLFLT